MSFLSEFRFVLAIAVVALAAPVLLGCVGTVVGAGATAGTAAMEMTAPRKMVARLISRSVVSKMSVLCRRRDEVPRCSDPCAFHRSQ